MFKKFNMISAANAILASRERVMNGVDSGNFNLNIFEAICSHALTELVSKCLLILNKK